MMRTTSSILIALPLLAGCVTTDEQGRPIAREVSAKPTAVDAAMASATLDGSRIVASGRAGAVSYLYPGTGRVMVRDLTANAIPFSIDLTERDGPATRTLIAIAADGKLTGTASGPNGPVVTDLGQLDKSHTFAITFLPAAPASPRGGEVR